MPFQSDNAVQIDDDTWYRRMDELEMTLARYWSWVEKALFAFAFAASVLIVSVSLC